MSRLGGKKLKSMLDRQANRRGLGLKKSDHPVTCDENFSYEEFMKTDADTVTMIAGSRVAKQSAASQKSFKASTT